MRKFTILLLILVSALVPAFAQKKDKDHKSMHKEIMEFKIKFLAQEMELKADQQKKFSELYASMSKEKFAVFKEIRDLKDKLSDKATDAEYEAYSKGLTEAKEKEAEIEKKYDAKFSEFLTQRQIFKMKEGEEKFREKMHEMRGKKQRGKK